MATFIIATPTAQIISPKITNLILPIGTDETVNGLLVHHPEMLGLEGWQWVYILWGLPTPYSGTAPITLSTADFWVFLIRKSSCTCR